MNYAPEILGTAPYTHDMAEWLDERAWDVRVVTTFPYYPEWRRRRGDPRLAYRWERDAGVTTVRCPSWIPAVPSGLKRLGHYASFAASSLPVVLAHVAWRPDFILVVAPTLASAPGALLAARLSRGRSWLHVQDYEVDVALRLGLLPPVARAALKRFESALLRSFDLVSSITDPMLAAAQESGVPAEKLMLVPNWASLGCVRPLERPSRFRAELGIPVDRPVVLYCGNLGRKQGVITIGDAARRSQDSGSPALYVVSGAGAEHQALSDRAQELGLANLIQLPLQPDESFNELLNLADVHLLIQEAGVADLVMPSKLTNMLASGRPVIATAVAGTGLERLIRENDVGAVVEPGDPDAIAGAVDGLVASLETCARQGANARRYAEAWLDRDAILSSALTRLEYDVCTVPHRC